MDRKIYLRILGLDESASRENLILAYRRLMIQWHPERSKPSDSSDADRTAQTITSAFLFLDKSYPQKSTRPSQGKGVRATDRLPRFQISSFEPTSLIFSPARSVTDLGFIPTLKDPKKSIGSSSEATKPPIQSTALIGGMVVVFLLIAFSFVKVESRQNPFPIASPVSPTTSTESATAIRVEPTPSIPAPTNDGRILARTNQANATIELHRQDASAPFSARRTDDNGFEFLSLPSGAYKLIGHLEGWPDVVRTIALSAHQSVTVWLEFVGGSLRIESDPSNATVRIGGKLVGRTPFMIKGVPPGSQSIALQYKSWPELTTTVAVEANRETNETIRIPYGQLDIESIPSGAMVSIDGEDVGRTPMLMNQVPSGKRQLRLAAENYEPYETVLNITDHGTLKIQPKLTSNVVLLEPNNLLNLVWTNSQPDLERITTFRPKNGVIKNLDRQKLYAKWAGRFFRYEGIVKQFDPKTGILEFSDESGEKSKFRITAQLSSSARTNKAFLTKLPKGAHIEIFGRFAAAEEPRWPFKTILFELIEAEPVN